MASARRLEAALEAALGRSRRVLGLAATATPRGRVGAATAGGPRGPSAFITS
jgi:hypothetical protein